MMPDDPLSGTLLRNDFARTAPQQSQAFPLRIALLRSLRVVLPDPAKTPQHTSAMSGIQHDYRTSWIRLDSNGVPSCSQTVPASAKAIVAASDDGRLFGFVEQDFSMAGCLEDVRVIRMPATPVSCSVDPKGMLGCVVIAQGGSYSTLILDLSTGATLLEVPVFILPVYSDDGLHILWIETEFVKPPCGRIRVRRLSVVRQGLSSTRTEVADSGWITDSTDGNAYACDPDGSALCYLMDDATGTAVRRYSFADHAVSTLGVIPSSGMAQLARDGAALVTVGTEVRYYSLRDGTVRQEWSVPLPNGNPFRLDLSSDGKFVAMHCQRAYQAGARHDLYVWDADGALVLANQSDGPDRDRVQGLLFINGQWLCEGMQYSDEQLHFNETLTSRQINLYPLPPP